MIDYGAAIDSVKKSSKSELSSRFFGRLKFWTANFRTDGRGGFVGGAAASGAGVGGVPRRARRLRRRRRRLGRGVGGAAIGRAFDRGATAPRSNDLIRFVWPNI